MLKSIAGVVVGYLVMMVVAFAAYTAAYLGLGTERAFEGDTYALSGTWMGLVIVITFIAEPATFRTLRPWGRRNRRPGFAFSIPS